MRPGELVGRRADVHVGIVQDKVLEMDKFALKPKGGGGVIKILACDPAVADRAFGHALVEAGQSIFGAGERADQGTQRKIGESVSH